MSNHSNRRSKLDRLLDQIKRLAPNQIAEAERALMETRRRAEACVEIDGAAAERACPGCGSDERHKWGRTERGEQRWRCTACKRTWSGLTGTGVAGVHRPDLFLEAVRDMFGDAPLSCRKLARKLGISRDTVWRWRMRVLSGLPRSPDEVFQGIVEADETFQRESRKGSREWVRHHGAPGLHPQPPRQRWRDYGRQGPPQADRPALPQACSGGRRPERPREPHLHSRHPATDNRRGTPAPGGAGCPAAVRRRAAVSGDRHRRRPGLLDARWRAPEFPHAGNLPPEHHQLAPREVEEVSQAVSRSGDPESRWLCALARRPAGRIPPGIPQASRMIRKETNRLC